MTTQFKTELQKLIDDAANERASNYNIGRAVKEWSHDVETFKAGCDFLLPLIEELIRQRNMHIPDTFGDGWDFITSENHNKQLLNLLRGGK